MCNVYTQEAKSGGSPRFKARLTYVLISMPSLGGGAGKMLSLVLFGKFMVSARLEVFKALSSTVALSSANVQKMPSGYLQKRRHLDISVV